MLGLLLLRMAAAAWSASSDHLQLEKVIILSRHGIRTPYPASYIGFNNYSILSADGRLWPVASYLLPPVQFVVLFAARSWPVSCYMTRSTAA